ncbi:hypothetical protein F5X97DRAFT_63912 [Nemania serpens]|nr:hypothetical protein F5X97DRAFT_63912 [Nemania serpens]
MSNAQSSVLLYTAYDFRENGVGSAPAVIVFSPRENVMMAAAVNGVLDIVKDPPFDCPGSPCKYPSFATSGLCSECADIPETIGTTLLHEINQHSDEAKARDA